MAKYESIKEVVVAWKGREVAHVICCNDTVEKVVLGTLEEAEIICRGEKEKMAKLKPRLSCVLHWHIHTVDLIDRR